MTTLNIAYLTFRETQRRRILWVALAMGIGFLIVFALGFHYVYKDVSSSRMRQDEIDMVAGFLLMAGLYATNFLIIVMSVLTSVTTISGEIDSHTVESLVTKPIRRWELVLGKWLGYALLLLAYIFLLAGGIVLIVYLLSGITVTNPLPGIGLMVMQGMVVLSVSLLGGTRLSTLANGVLAFMLYGVAFLGSWVEQIGAFLKNETAVNIGIITSLIMPSEVLWRKAASLFLPQFVNSPFAGPFTISSQPSPLMLWYAVFYAIVLLLLALWSFSARDL
ncbi:MAG: ABC transporter permease subunit [Ardenticatenaceae bacterium]|nr:ABC transporter permease subunit [Ardenticatenaceae bacterium]